MQILIFLVIVGGSIALSIILLRLSRRKFPGLLTEQDHEVAGHFLGTVAGFYGVLLAFVVVAVWGQFQDATLLVTREANHLGDLLRLSRGFPEPAQSRMQASLINYSRAVITQEWPDMAAHRESTAAWDALSNVWAAYHAFEPQTPAQVALYQLSLNRLAELSDARRFRLLSARAKVPVVLWAVLDLGAILTVFFTMLFRLHNAKAQSVMTASLAGLISLILFLIMSFDRPFDGAIRVKPEVFERELQRMGVSVQQ